MLTDVLADIFALCASADSGPQSGISPRIIDNLFLELKKANCGCFPKYGLSYLPIDQSDLLQCVTAREDI